MKRFLAAATVGLLFVACGSAQAAQKPAGNGTTTASSAGTVVNVTLSDDMRIVADRSSVPAGTVTFHVTNTGKLTHEAVLLKTDIAYDQLPANPQKAGKIVEDNGSTITHIGETDDM
ncbi:MAG: hypothetical protein KGQ88_10240, partial [Chloroflexi bacterium]|nr:hypothetical protein [Chloroflexota bacterium]